MVRFRERFARGGLDERDRAERVRVALLVDGREPPRALDLDDDVERRRVASVVRRRRGVVDGRVRLLDGVAIEAQLRGARAARVATHASARPFLLIKLHQRDGTSTGRLPHKR